MVLIDEIIFDTIIDLRGSLRISENEGGYSEPTIEIDNIPFGATVQEKLKEHQPNGMGRVSYLVPGKWQVKLCKID